MCDFYYTKANLKKLSKNQLYAMMYAKYTSPLTRGQIVNELESRTPHHIFFKNGKRMRHFIVDTPEYEMLNQSLWEIEQADLAIIPVNGV